jgi:hypothetical protein
VSVYGIRGRGCKLLARCTAITGGGSHCKGMTIDSSGYCHAHHPDRAEQRRRAARRTESRGFADRQLVGIVLVLCYPFAPSSLL